MSAIRLHGAGRTYSLYERPLDRVLEIFMQRRRHQEVAALRPTDLDVPRGQVLGVIGNNGAGKSTLLKLIAGTLTPSAGEVEVRGSVAALLELGGGFHPDMTGRENVFLKGAIMGIGRDSMTRLYDEIADFAGLNEFMDQAVKTYSSGMFMRLAFAVATCVEPNILLIDEALSVGDGAFARKSFDRIMAFKSNGCTILFCSHSLYQVEAVCDRVIWIDRGVVRMDGVPSDVIGAYNTFVNTETVPELANAGHRRLNGDAIDAPGQIRSKSGVARLHRVTVSVDSESGRRLKLRSKESDLSVEVDFVSDPAMEPPTVGVAITKMDGQVVCSAGSHNDGRRLQRDADGRGSVTLCFPEMPILKGIYGVDVYLLCENGIHVYEEASLVAELNVVQSGLEQGVVSLPHEWHQRIAESAEAYRL